MKKKIVVLISVILLFLFTCSYKELKEVKIEINNEIFSFEIADTPSKRRTGLMFRKKLNQNSGMLFVYPNEFVLSFYMKNTLIPLDIAFINSELTVIDIQSMNPLDETPIESKGKAQYALEVNKGFFKKVGLKVGDKIKFITPIIYPKE